MVAVALRRTQAERTAETRDRLLTATLDCVVEKGYAGASTTEIVRRAGVSRGAQVHHFPTKEDLVLAAVEHMFERRLAEFRDVFGSLGRSERTASNALDLLWQLYRGPSFAAWLELAVAGRTETTLGERIRQLTAWFDSECRRIFEEFFGKGDQLTETALSLTFAAIDGAALCAAIGVGVSGDAVVDALKGLAFMFNITSGGTE